MADMKERDPMPQASSSPEIPPWWELVFGLFVAPNMALRWLRDNRVWKPGLRFLLVLLFLFSVVDTWQTLRKPRLFFKQVVAEYVPQITPLVLKERRLSWPDTAPQHYQKGTLSIELMQDGAKVPQSICPNMLLIYPDQIRCRMQLPNMEVLSSESADMVILSPAMLQKLSDQDPSGIVISGKMLRKQLSFGFWVFSLFLCLVGYLEVLWVLGSSLFCFWLVSLLFHKMAFQNKAAMLIITLNLVIPPTVVTVLWCCLMPGPQNFSSLFCWAFLIYLVYMMYLRRKAMMDSRGR